MNVGNDEFSGGSGGKERKDAGELLGASGAGEFGNVAVGYSADAVAEPHPPRPTGHAERFGESTCTDPREIVSRGEFGRLGVGEGLGTIERGGKESRRESRRVHPG